MFRRFIFRADRFPVCQVNRNIRSLRDDNKRTDNRNSNDNGNGRFLRMRTVKAIPCSIGLKKKERGAMFCLSALFVVG
jgi:hypothetical protein